MSKKASGAQDRKAEAQRPETMEDLDRRISVLRGNVSKAMNLECRLLTMGDASIEGELVDRMFDDLLAIDAPGAGLCVVLDSLGGDIDAAYNLALLLRRYGSKQLIFVVPRWAKSAATLLACGGDKIMMTPVAELGPIDPQITEMNPMKRRIEQFSPLHIESTLELIRQEYKMGTDRLADGLVQRLQFPLTLGSFKKSLDIGMDYAGKLLSTRMLEGDEKTSFDIARKLTTGYASHSYCINCQEAIDIGLKAEELSGDMLRDVWEMHKLCKKRHEMLNRKRQEEIDERLKDYPPELLNLMRGAPEKPSRNR